jgi:predicted AAA+ superfamily ATPase
MALSDSQIVAQNPWWTDAGWRVSDPHLALLDRQPMRLPADFVGELDLADEGVHILRGPRQVGKSTDLKLLVERALQAGRDPRSVTYLALDLLEGQHHAELAETILRAKALAGRSVAGIILLDEVTLVARWQTAVKALWDGGEIRRDLVVCTGSSAIDLRRGAAERLPGRRGAGVDHLVLPQSFAVFARALDRSIPGSPGLTAEQLVAPAGRDILMEARIHGPGLEDALERYMRFGGLPAAVAEAAAGLRSPSEALRRVLYDSLVREVQRRGAGVPATHALLERVIRSLGSKTDWSRMAREMDVPLSRRRGPTSHQTLRDYIELLADGYFLFIVYFWRTNSQTNSLSNDKKVFFADPLLHTIALEHISGRSADAPALIENLVGLALYRRYEPPSRLIETFASPERLHIWQTAKGGEVDFVAGPRDALDAVEVKYRKDIDLRSAAAVARAHPGRPAILATRQELSFREAYALIPAHLLLWALG